MRDAITEGKQIELNPRGLIESWRIISHVNPSYSVARYRIHDPYRHLKDAYKQGEVIQYTGSKLGEWKNCPVYHGGEDDLEWCNPVNHYRIKPKEPQYVPFTFEDHELFIGKQIQFKELKVIYTITHCNAVSVGWPTFDKSDSMNLNNALKKLTFIDGTPFGKLVE